jgi:CubicO group peptidase (beta-lactamase class C family)
MRRISCFLPILLMTAPLALPTNPASAAPPAETRVKVSKAAMDKALAKMVADGRVVGAEALVWQNGKQVYFGATGLVDREKGKPLTRDAIMQIFSMTKPVTGVALMQLWEKGLFGLDDPIDRYFPEFANMQVYAGKDASGAPRYVPASRKITVRDIMRHTAGFAYGAGDTPAHAAFVKADPLNWNNSLPEMAQKLASAPLLFDPGTEWSYSAGVDLQAALVEKLSGQPFADYVKQHIFDPLGMHDTGWRVPDDKSARFAASYERKDGKLVRVDDIPNRYNNFLAHKLTPGGHGLASTIDDYMRFARMLLNGGELDGVRILKPGTVRLMSTNQLDDRITRTSWLTSKGSVRFGLDFAVRTRQPQTPEEPRGAVGEFFWDGAETTQFFIDPANNLAAVLFVQVRPFDVALQPILRAGIYGKDYLGPKGD